MKLSIRQINMILFALYNMVYVLYRMHILNNEVNSTCYARGEVLALAL
jgi:hypothetical protein